MLHRDAASREQRAWLFFGAALVVVAAALLALIAVWLIQSSRARLAIDARERLDAELRTAREEHAAIANRTELVGEEAQESARRAAEAARIADSAGSELARARDRLRAFESRFESLDRVIADPSELPRAELVDVLGPDPALTLRVFLESDPPHARLSTASLEEAVRELVPSKRFSLDDDAEHYLVLSVVHEASAGDPNLSLLSLMLCVEGPLWTPGASSISIGEERSDRAARQAWVRLWCRHTLGSAPSESLPALSRGLVNELLDLLSSEFSRRPAGEEPVDVADPARPEDDEPAPNGADPKEGEPDRPPERPPDR